jgi:hypothetical protein
MPSLFSHHFAHSLLHCSPIVSQLGEPEPLSKEDEKDAGPLIDLFGERVACGLYSKVWQHREQAIKVQIYIYIYLCLSLLTIILIDSLPLITCIHVNLVCAQFVNNELHRCFHQADVGPQNLYRALIPLLKRLLNDKMPQVFVVAGEALTRLASEFVGMKTAGSIMLFLSQGGSWVNLLLS